MSVRPSDNNADLVDSRDEQREQRRSAILADATQRYLRGSRIELTVLAAEHGIGRATAYRWFGDNDRLLAEVLAERVQENYTARVRENTAKSGRDRVLAVIDGVLRHAADSRRLEALLRREPTRVLKILTSNTHDVQRLQVFLLETLLTEEHLAGHLELAVPAHTLAYAIVRLMETYLYANVLADEKRDITSAVRVIGLLLPTKP